MVPNTVMGPFTNYVKHFSLFFDHLPTYSNVFVINLPMTYSIPEFGLVMLLLATQPPQLCYAMLTAPTKG